MPVAQNTTHDDVYPPKWLKADMLEGKQVTLRVTDINVEGIPVPPSYREERKIVVSLEGYPDGPRWILSRTNAQDLAGRLGTDKLNEWIGARVKVSPKRLPSGKYTIRVDAAAKPAPKADESRSKQESDGDAGANTATPQGRATHGVGGAARGERSA